MRGVPDPRAGEIFLALADLPIDARAEHVRRACGSDAALRAEVEAMLEALDMPEERFLDPASIPALDMNALDGPLQAGTLLGQFLVLHAIGSGGMGVVYAAQQEHPRRTVAIKVLRRGFRQPDIVRRFEREAEVLGRLQHPGIAQVFAFHPGNRQAPAHLVMEMISGPSITEFVRAHQLTTSRKVALVALVCDALQHAHDRGVVHRDLKPANVLVTADGQPKVLDFGIARLLGLDVQSVHTEHGQLIGTLAYMSPEQLRGESAAIDGRSDVYALGVLLFRLLAGRQPFDLSGLALISAVQHILQGGTPLLGDTSPELRGPLETLTARAMARRREDRFESAAQMAAELRAYLEGRLPASYDRAVPGSDRRFLGIGLTSGSLSFIDTRTGHVEPCSEIAGSRVSSISFNQSHRASVVWSNGRRQTIDIPDSSD